MIKYAPLPDKFYMHRYGKSLNRILANVEKNPFKFKGTIKYYPGRSLDEKKAQVFSTWLKFFRFMEKLPKDCEYIAFDKRTREVGVKFKDEAIMFIWMKDGTRKVSFYEESFGRDYRRELDMMCWGSLAEELTGLFEEMKSGGKTKSFRKLAS